MATEYVDAGAAIPYATLSNSVGKAPAVTKGLASDRILNAREEPQNWLTYYGTYDGQRFSRLAQVTPANVRSLGVAWQYQEPPLGLMAGQVGLADHLHISDGALLGAKAGLMTDALPGKRYLGAPAVEERQFFRSISLIQQLPEIRRQLHEAQRAIIRLAGTGESASPTNLGLDGRADAA